MNTISVSNSLNYNNLAKKIKSTNNSISYSNNIKNDSFESTPKEVNFKGKEAVIFDKAGKYAKVSIPIAIGASLGIPYFVNKKEQNVSLRRKYIANRDAIYHLTGCRDYSLDFNDTKDYYTIVKPWREPMIKGLAEYFTLNDIDLNDDKTKELLSILCHINNVSPDKMSADDTKFFAKKFQENQNLVKLLALRTDPDKIKLNINYDCYQAVELLKMLEKNPEIKELKEKFKFLKLDDFKENLSIYENNKQKGEALFSKMNDKNYEEFISKNNPSSGLNRISLEKWKIQEVVDNNLKK